MKFPILLSLLLATAALGQDKPKPATPKPADAKPATPKPADARPADARPADAKVNDGAAVKGAEPLPSVSTSVPTKQDFLASTDIPARMAAEFFGLLEKNQIEDAYAGLTKGSKMVEKPEDMRLLKQKTKEAIEVFGTIVGFELFETKPVGTRLIRRTYLSLGSEYPLRWRFYFYNANSRWRLIDMRVDDKLTGMFDEPTEPRADDTHLPPPALEK